MYVHSKTHSTKVSSPYVRAWDDDESTVALQPMGVQMAPQNADQSLPNKWTLFSYTYEHKF